MPRKTIYQIDVETGKVIAKYLGLRKANEATGVSTSCICICCRSHGGLSGGYVWCYSKDVKAVVHSIKNPVRLSDPEVVEILKKYHDTLSYREITMKTGYSYEELRDIYDKYKIYRKEDENNG